MGVNVNKIRKPISLEKVTIASLFFLACGKENLKSCIYLSMGKNDVT